MKNIVLAFLILALILPAPIISGCKSSNAAPSASQVPARFVFTTQPDGATAGTAFTQQPVVSVVDAYGNVVTGYNWWVALLITPGTGTSGASLIGTVLVDAVNGVATFTGISINAAGSGYTLTATDQSTISTTSAPFNVAATASTNES